MRILRPMIDVGTDEPIVLLGTGVSAHLGESECPWGKFTICKAALGDCVGLGNLGHFVRCNI